MPEPVTLACPYCGEPIELIVDETAGSAAYVEDCPVCCNPMQVRVEVDGERVSVTARTGNE
ncbi:MAG: CPXCG motif-containing cysteine-rich protein [Rhodanobacteraceae bacterium]|nr:MAG: CPXCG motif-containing cysteine-rich protein [Rhodanobacteraceae bacterium]